MVEEFTFTYEEKQEMATRTAEILTEEIGLKGDAIQAVHLIPDIEEGKLSMADVEALYGASVVRILEGLDRIHQLYQKNPVVESENFRNLLLSFAEDMYTHSPLNSEIFCGVNLKFIVHGYPVQRGLR